MESGRLQVVAIDAAVGPHVESRAGVLPDGAEGVGNAEAELLVPTLLRRAAVELVEEEAGVVKVGLAGGVDRLRALVQGRQAGYDRGREGCAFCVDGYPGVADGKCLIRGNDVESFTVVGRRVPYTGGQNASHGYHVVAACQPGERRLTFVTCGCDDDDPSLT